MPTPTPVFLLMPSGMEWVVIGAIVVLLFGASKLPELARSMGLAQKEYHQAKREAQAELAAGDADADADASERERLEKAARDLGIDTDGKSVSELKAAIRAAME